MNWMQWFTVGQITIAVGLPSKVMPARHLHRRGFIWTPEKFAWQPLKPVGSPGSDVGLDSCPSDCLARSAPPASLGISGRAQMLRPPPFGLMSAPGPGDSADPRRRSGLTRAPGAGLAADERESATEVGRAPAGPPAAPGQDPRKSGPLRSGSIRSELGRADAMARHPLRLPVCGGVL